MVGRIRRSGPGIRACWVAALLVTVAVTVGLSASGGGGADRFEPTKLDWLVLQLNAKDRLQNPFGAGLVEYEAAPPDTVVVRLLSSTIRYGSGGLEEVAETSRKVVLAEAERWGFSDWVRTKEQVLAPGEGFR